MKAIRDGIRSYLRESRDIDEYHFRLTNIVAMATVLIFAPSVAIIHWLITLLWRN